MPLTDAIIVTAIVAAFIVFGMVLAWGEYQTRHLGRPARALGASEAKKTIEAVQPPTSAAAAGLKAAG